jgi:hypothetical protein
MSIVNEPNCDPKSQTANAHETTPPVRPRPRWWQRWSVWFLLAVLACLAVPFCDRAYHHHAVAKELENALADMDRQEPGWHLKDVEAARAVIPDDQNCTVVVRDAFGRLPHGWPSAELSDRFYNLSPQERLDDADAAFLHDAMSEVQRVLADARKAATRPNGRWPINYSRDFVGTLLPEMQHTRTIFFLLHLDVLAQAQDGDLKGALRSCKALLNAARSIGDEPLMVSQLVRIAGVIMACQSVERVLGQGDPDPDDLLDMQRRLEQEERFPRLLVAFRGERGGMHELLDALECGDANIADLVRVGSGSEWDNVTDYASRDSVREQHPVFLALLTEAIQIAALPTHQRAAPLRALEAKAMSQPPGVIRLLMPAYGKVDEAARRTDAALRSTITALAVERYRHRYGRWPDTLQQLVPDFLAAIPLDPEDGTPLGFHRRDDRVVIYSVCRGPMKMSQVMYDPKESPPPGVGVAVHLFDVNQRRQPRGPKPVPPQGLFGPARID